MTDWDQKVKPRLNFIAAGAEMASRNTRALPINPGFPTAAVDELEDAKRVLEVALQKVIAALDEYHAKPLESVRAA